MPTRSARLIAGVEPSGRFCTTHWSAIHRAGDPSAPSFREAMGQLCSVYWYPLYLFARQRGVRPADCQDLVQGFFSHLLEKNCVARADRQLGRFRAFLLASFKNYMANERARSQSVKRGGRVEFLSLDAVAAEDRYLMEATARTYSPEEAYARSWAVSTLQQALARLRAEYLDAGNAQTYDALKSLLWAERGEETYAELGVRLRTTEAAVKMAAMRLRRRCRAALKAEVAQTVADPDEVEDELRYLISVLQH